MLLLWTFHFELIIVDSSVEQPFSSECGAWCWTRACKQAFKASKDKIVSLNILVHYDPRLPICLATDSSVYGIGAIISHILDHGMERTIAYTSMTLLPSEGNYLQVEKEAFSLVFGICKFHIDLYGRMLF